MKTLKPLILTFLVSISIIIFAFNKPQNFIISNHNFGINDTIDTLKPDLDLFF